MPTTGFRTVVATLFLASQDLEIATDVPDRNVDANDRMREEIAALGPKFR